MTAVVSWAVLSTAQLAACTLAVGAHRRLARLRGRSHPELVHANRRLLYFVLAVNAGPIVVLGATLPARW